MNAKVSELINALVAMPDSEQTSVAERFLEELKWEQTFEQPESMAFLEQLRQKAEADHQNGRIIPTDRFSQFAEERKKKSNK